jgi:hypothetical protein
VQVIEPEIQRGVNKVVFEVLRASNGDVERYTSYNARTNAGAQAIAQLIGSAAGLPFKYVGLTTNNTAPLAGDTVLTSEYTTNGLSRAAGTYGTYTAPASLGATASYILTAQWTCTATGQTINKIAAFTTTGPPPAGIMGFETLLGSTITLNNGDLGTLTWTFTV